MKRDPIKDYGVVRGFPFTDEPDIAGQVVQLLEIVHSGAFFVLI